MNYYNEIKNELIDNELTRKAKDYSINKSDLIHYYNVGKLLVDAQGGEKNAKYGNKLIKEYSEKLTCELGKGYSWRNLYNMRLYFIISNKNEILQPVVANLTWTNCTIILSLKDINEIMYYWNECEQHNLSKRELLKKIKEKEYQRLSSETKNKLIRKEEPTLTDFIKNPIVIKNALNINYISEKYLKKLILEDIDSFLKELGNSFTYVGNEYKIKIGNVFNYIDILLFNIKFNCYVVVELKMIELKKEHIGQIEIYMNYIDRNLRQNNHNKTIGIIICKHDNKLVLEYSSDPRIFSTTYVLN